jgi:predicted MFS family arabinose efflux permease
MRGSHSIAALAFGYFAVGTGAFVVAGLLNEIASDLGTSAAGVGQLMAGYSLALAIGAPLLAPLGARFERRTLITGGLALFALLHVASAVRPPMACWPQPASSQESLPRSSPRIR